MLSAPRRTRETADKTGRRRPRPGANRGASPQAQGARRASCRKRTGSAFPTCRRRAPGRRRRRFFRRPNRRRRIEENRRQENVENIACGNKQEVDRVAVERRIHGKRQRRPGVEDPPQRNKDQRERSEVQDEVEQDQRRPGDHHVARVEALPYGVAAVFAPSVRRRTAHGLGNQRLHQAQRLVNEKPQRGV